MGRGRVRVLLVALVLTGAVAACGGEDGDDGPTAPRSAEEEFTTLDRLGQELYKNNCREPSVLWHSGLGQVTRKDCLEAFDPPEDFLEGDLRPAGPAAIVDFGQGALSTVGLVLDHDRRYRVVAVTSQVQGRPSPATDRLAERAVDAMADGNCKALASLRIDSRHAGDPCEQRTVAAFIRAANSGGTPPQPRRLGGEDGIAFYEVRAEDRFFVVVLIEAKPGKFGFANVLRAG